MMINTAISPVDIWNGELRAGGGGESWSVPVRRVGVQRELRDDYHRSADVDYGAVRLARVILEDAQLEKPLGETRRVRIRVAVSHPKED